MRGWSITSNCDEFLCNRMNSNTKVTNLTEFNCKLANSVANSMNSTAKATNSTLNRTNSIAKATDSTAKHYTYTYYVAETLCDSVAFSSNNVL